MKTTIPIVKRNPDTKPLREVVAEIMTDKHAYCVDGIPQYDPLHTAMVHTQDRILKYLDAYWSLDKEEIDDLSFRCKEVSKYLDLISKASLQNRYTKLPDSLEEQIDLNKTDYAK